VLCPFKVLNPACSQKGGRQELFERFKLGFLPEPKCD
jgi:hypothetical protein